MPRHQENGVGEIREPRDKYVVCGIVWMHFVCLTSSILVTIVAISQDGLEKATVIPQSLLTTVKHCYYTNP